MSPSPDPQPPPFTPRHQVAIPSLPIAHIKSLMMETEMVLETSVSFINLTRLIALEDFIELVCCLRSVKGFPLRRNKCPLQRDNI
jgi:hypothetical protein